MPDDLYCPNCGIPLKGSRCPSCGQRPRYTRWSKKLRGGAGPFPNPQTQQALLESWFLNPLTWNIINQAGSTSTSHGSLIALSDNLNSTFDSVTASGTGGGTLGLIQQDVQGTLTNPTQYHPVTAGINLVRVNLKGVVEGSPGPTAVIYTYYDGDFLPSSPLPDDYLAPPPAAFTPNWLFYDYSQDPRTQTTWDYTNLTTRTWGFRQLLETFTDADTNTLKVIEFRVDLFGPL